jgi:Tol biopolymer transport system component
LVGIIAIAALPASAKVCCSKGRIVVGRFDPAVNDFHIFSVNADGTNDVQLLPGIAECPRWSPDGEKIQICVFDPKGLLRPATLNPDGSDFRLLDNPDPSLNLWCWAWSSRGRLAWDSWDDGKRLVFSLHLSSTNRQDIYTARADGTDLRRVTNTPGSLDFADWGTHSE